jgi:mercuric ion transport protein
MTMAAGSESGPVPADRIETQATGTTLLAAGGILAALGASSCCVLPFALFTLGASGAWIGNLTALAPHQPLFLALALACLAAGFVVVYRRPKAVCGVGSVCARPVFDRFAKAGLWAGTVLVVVALAFPYIAPLILGS